jgi:hypothetical protein
MSVRLCCLKVLAISYFLKLWGPTWFLKLGGVRVAVPQEDVMVLSSDHSQTQPVNAIVPVGQTDPGQVMGKIHIGMTLLLDSIDFDHVYERVCENRGFNSCPPKQNTESIRLWAKFFAPQSSCDGFQIPQMWRDFTNLELCS